MTRRWNLLAATVAVLSLSYASPVLGQTPQFVDSLIVVDTDGKKLGPVIDAGISQGGAAVVPFDIGNGVFLLQVLETKFLGIGFPGSLS